MRNEKGQFLKGHSGGKETQFKRGQHWRKPAPFREKNYLLKEYGEKQRSAQEIALEHGVTENAILYWLQKNEVRRRTVKQVRANKHWAVSGEQNGMFGKFKDESPNWRGGITPERQGFYSSAEWVTACSIVYKRDNCTCQRCGVTKSVKNPIHVHHIVSFAVRHLRAEASNLILLCKRCHNWVHSRENKNKEFILEIGIESSATTINRISTAAQKVMPL